MSQSSFLKPMVYVEYKWHSVFKPELLHNPSQSPSWGNPSSAPPSRAAQNFSQLLCKDVSVPLTYLSITQWGLPAVIKISCLTYPLLLSYSEEEMKNKDWASQGRYLLFSVSSKQTTPSETHLWSQVDPQLVSLAQPRGWSQIVVICGKENQPQLCCPFNSFGHFPRVLGLWGGIFEDLVQNPTGGHSLPPTLKQEPRYFHTPVTSYWHFCHTCLHSVFS